MLVTKLICLISGSDYAIENQRVLNPSENIEVNLDYDWNIETEPIQIRKLKLQEVFCT